MTLKFVPGRVVVKVDLESKNSHTFKSGQTIRLERQYDNFNRRETQPVNATVVSAENIPEGSEVLMSHNALHDVNKIFNYKTLSGKDEASSEKFFSISETECFAWRDNTGELKPMKDFVFALRVYKPYTGSLQGIEPSLIKQVLYITTGGLAGNVCHVLKAADYEIVFQGQDGREDRVIRLRHSDMEEIEREEIIAVSHNLTEDIMLGNLLVGLTPSTAKSIEILV